jgi:hypothetical protein
MEDSRDLKKILGSFGLFELRVPLVLKEPLILRIPLELKDLSGSNEFLELYVPLKSIVPLELKVPLELGGPLEVRKSLELENPLNLKTALDLVGHLNCDLSKVLGLKGPLNLSGSLESDVPMSLSSFQELNALSGTSAIEDREKSHIQQMWELLSPGFNERERRLFGAAWAISCGHGGISFVNSITGISLNSLSSGSKELLEGIDDNEGRIRKHGGGTKHIEFHYPDI